MEGKSQLGWFRSQLCCHQSGARPCKWDNLLNTKLSIKYNAAIFQSHLLMSGFSINFIKLSIKYNAIFKSHLLRSGFAISSGKQIANEHHHSTSFTWLNVKEPSWAKSRRALEQVCIAGEGNGAVMYLSGFDEQWREWGVEDSPKYLVQISANEMEAMHWYCCVFVFWWKGKRNV